MSVTELIGGAIGLTMLALGLASVMAWTLRRSRAERVLLWFGVWSANGHDARTFAAVALDDLKRWRGGTAFDDDVTFVVARFSASAGSNKG